MLQPSLMQLPRDVGRSSMRPAWAQPCSQQAWVGSPKLQGDHRQEQGANLAVMHEINRKNSLALAVPPSQPCQSLVAMVRFTPHQEFTVCKWTHTWFPLLCKKDMNFLGWEREKKNPTKPTNQRFLFLVGHRDCAIIPGCSQLAHSREFSTSSTWWQKGHSGHCLGHRTGLQGDRDSGSPAAILHECPLFCMALVCLLSWGLQHTGKETQSPMCSHGVCGMVRKPPLRRRHIARKQ